MFKVFVNNDTRRHLQRAGFVVAASALLFLFAWAMPQTFLIDPVNFTWMHTVMEMFAVVVSLAIFSVAWNAWIMERSGHLVILACAFLVVGLVDIGHTLSYKGMPAFVTPSGGGKAIYFWIVARSAAALALIYLALHSERLAIRSVTRYVALVVSLSLVGLTYWTILFHQAELPAMYADDKGLTSFKIKFEYVLLAAFGCATILFCRVARRTHAIAPIYLAAAASVSMLSEACFASYTSQSDAYSFIGHVLKVVAYAMIYRAIFVEAAREPFLRERRAESDLHTSESRFKAIIESTPVPFAVNDAQGNITYVNPKFVRTFGYTLADIPTLADWWPRAYPDVSYREWVMSTWNTAVEKALRKGVEVEPIEINIVCKDGSQRTVLANPAPMDESHLVFLYDITERKRVETALQESLQFAQLIANNVPGMLAYWTTDLRCAFANDAYLEWFGYTPEQMHGIAMQQLLGDTLFRKNEPYIRAAMRGEAQQFERTLVKPTGETGYTWAQYIPRTVEGNVHGFFALVIDITALKQAEQALRESETRLNKAQEIAHLGSWDLDIITNRLTWSNEVYRIFGLQPQSFAATYEAFVERIHPDDRAAVNGAYTGSLQNNLASYEIEHRIIRHDTGEVRYVHEKCEHIRDAAGQIVRSVGMVHDITERTLLQKQAVQAQKMQAIGQLTGGIAHDFNNILASILGYTDLALERFVPDKESKLALYLSEIKRASERARDLIAKMLAFSRGGQGEVQSIAVVPLIAEVIQLLHAVLPSTIELITKAETDLPVVMMDPIHLHQMVMNLCINARDAVGAHGRIEIGLARRTTETVCTSCLQSVRGEWIEISVSDNGSGIEPEALTHIFEPFFSTKEVGKGTGLGLSTVHGLVHGYGGHIVVDSTPNKGTTVRLLLPASESNAHFPTLPGAVKSIAKVRAGERILVVDDELSIGQMLGEAFEHHGYQSAIFADSTAALKDFRAHPTRYAALVTDYTMPGLNGIELTQAVLALRANLPVILCSGYADQVDTDNLASLGVRRFFLKPVSNLTLLQALDELLQTKV